MDRSLGKCGLQMAGRHRSDHVAIKVPDEPGSPTHSRHAANALRGQSACPRPQYPTLRGNRTIKNEAKEKPRRSQGEAKEKPRVGNIRFYPPATRRQANILHRTARTCTSTPSANNFLPSRQDSAIAPRNGSGSHRKPAEEPPHRAPLRTFLSPRHNPQGAIDGPFGGRQGRTTQPLARSIIGSPLTS